MHRIIALTPAGRRRYLEVLAHYVLADPTIDEWVLWDNCRDPDDRDALDDLARRHPHKIQIMRLPGANGDLRSINRFYTTLRDANAFYIKMDDDLVYLPPRFGARLFQQARGQRGKYAWWSPLVINNALCSWLLKHHGRVEIDAELSAQAGCVHGWRSPTFALQLHRAFLDAVRNDAVSAFQIGNFPISGTRFSINCIGFFGSDVVQCGAEFCPPRVDDEEWISAVLPSRLGMPGLVVGHLLVSHFSFYTQEPELLRTNLLDDYYRLAGLTPKPYRGVPLPLKQRIKRRLLARLLGAQRHYAIRIPQQQEREEEKVRCLSPSQQ